MASIKSHINICIDEDILERIDNEAKQNSVSRSTYMNRIIRDFYNQRELYHSYFPEIMCGIDMILNRIEKYENQISVPDMNASAVLDTGVSEPASESNNKTPE